MNTQTPRSEPSRHLAVLVVLGFLSLLTAMLVTPADPVSFLLALFPIFLLTAAGYLYGFRTGRRSRDDSDSRH